MTRSIRLRAVLAAMFLAVGLPASAQTYSFEGDVPDDGEEFFLVPFEVPAGAVEIEVHHDDLSAENILDWGLYDPSGFRGWGGGNAEPAVVGVEAASRSYIPGELPEGQWAVVVGKAKILQPPGEYSIQVYVRTSNATLAPQTERAPYVPVDALETGGRWYAGDFHVHSVQSGDARPPLDEIATFARGRGLDFVALSDHNTNAQLDFILDAQERHPDLLFIPSVEFTTYAGHANAIGATEWVDHKIGFQGATIEAAGQAYLDQGALLTINHPALDLGNICIGCAWEHPDPGSYVGAVEIGTGGFSQSGYIFNDRAIEFWDALLNLGFHVSALGGSDDHRAGVDLGTFQSPIGDPTTMVFAEELSVAGILEGIRNGRTVVKLQGPGDPMIELDSTLERTGDTVFANRETFLATITGGNGLEFRFVVDGAPGNLRTIDRDPFTAQVGVNAPLEGQARVRAEVLVGDDPRTVTSHLWLQGDGTPPPKPSGCACSLEAAGPSAGTILPTVAALLCLAAGVRRRRIHLG